jgi:hypothetical protein
LITTLSHPSKTFQAIWVDIVEKENEVLEISKIQCGGFGKRRDVRTNHTIPRPIRGLDISLQEEKRKPPNGQRPTWQETTIKIYFRYVFIFYSIAFSVYSYLFMSTRF